VPICALCQSEVERLEDSHILPEFIYKRSNVYDDQGRMRYVVLSEGISELKQKGLREPLLCRPCEGRIGKWETYASRVLYRGLMDSKARQGPDNVTFLPGVDYSKFKLFQLSILWRAGVARRAEYSEVDLGEHEPLLRTALLGSDPRGIHFFPTSITRLDPVAVEHFRIVGVPEKNTIATVPVYHLLTGRIWWTWFVTPEMDMPEDAGLFISPDGVLPIHDASPENTQRAIERLKKALGDAWRGP
jgi:hypothetical protein